MRILPILLASLLVLTGVGCKGVSNADSQACSSNTGAPDVVLAACERALARDDVGVATRTELLVGRAMAWQAQGNDAAALADLDAAVRLSPERAEVLVNRGAFHRQRGELDAALRDLDAAIALDPSDSYAWLLRSAAHETRGDFVQSRADVDRGLALDPGFAPLWVQRCWVGAVLADELPRTLEDCKRALAFEPTNPNNENNMGFVHFRMKHHAASVEHYTRSIAGNPDDPSSYFVRGLARRALGDAEGAAADIARAESLDPGVAARYAGYGVHAGGGGARD